MACNVIYLVSEKKLIKKRNKTKDVVFLNETCCPVRSHGSIINPDLTWTDAIPFLPSKVILFVHLIANVAAELLFIYYKTNNIYISANKELL